MSAPELKKEKLRLDKYLWSIRVFKSRSMATEAIDKGRVKLNGENVKASRNVVIGDVYEARTEHKNWVLKVTQLLDGRVAYAEAIKYYEDLTPVEELERVRQVAATFQTGKRLSKIGRPTKKNRRDLGDFLD
ncbi:MAG: RNA-binding S4 domain-containing protein [Chitinophagaceae bacterium]|jgi:ribosome-associated heat shock protein Hsp15|nr:RNA-binding S4 domain-containing protein [Chitinophagaceae bacterium]MCF8288619.1 RNA-binding S4 domain-containing protein [Chitinophagaceae bacterium]MCF8421608.1 RNA-binding S4 domain-containing protein [Chitinophagaceae bacterium]